MRGILCFLSIGLLFAMGGCATHGAPHGGPSVGFSADIDTPIGGVDGSIGVHDPRRHNGRNDHYDHEDHRGSYRDGGYGGEPGARVLSVMKSSAVDELITSASCNGEGREGIRADADARESGYGASYSVRAQRTGECMRTRSRRGGGGGE